MNTQNIKKLLFIMIIILSLAVGACTRSASTPPADESGDIPEAVTGQQATMEAVRAALLTQTAQAETAAEESTATEEPTDPPPTETPTPEDTPESEETSDSTETEESTAPTSNAPAGTTEYTVLEGEWVYSIANKFGLDPQSIIDLNNLEAPYTLTVGQVLLIPGSDTSVPTSSPTQSATASAGGTQYTVLEGEWVYSIARKFGVDPQAIIDANNLEAPYTLHPGDVITIP